MQDRSESITKYMKPSVHETMKESFWGIHGKPSAPRAELMKWCIELSVCICDFIIILKVNLDLFYRWLMVAGAK
jgi:hypothetical protein